MENIAFLQRSISVCDSIEITGREFRA